VEYRPLYLRSRLAITVTAVVVITGVGVASQEEPGPILRPVLEQWREATDLCTETLGWVSDKVRIIGDEEVLFQALLGGQLRALR